MIKKLKDLIESNSIKEVGDVLTYDYYNCGDEIDKKIRSVEIKCADYDVMYVKYFIEDGFVVIDCLGDFETVACYESCWDCDTFINKGVEK